MADRGSRAGAVADDQRSTKGRSAADIQLQCARVDPGRAGIGITPGAVLVKERASARLCDAHRPVDLAVQREGGAVAHQHGHVSRGNG